MPVILVANPKGGVGKSTLASNIAGYLSHRGHDVMLGDIDRQQSSAKWLAQRPTSVPLVRGWELLSADALRTPKGVTHAVLDTPAGLHGKKLMQALKVADRVVVPLQPSLFDIQATYDFVRELQDAQQDRGHAGRNGHGNGAGGGTGKAVGLVAMRVRDGTLSQQQLQQFIGQLGLPLLAQLRDTQNYVQLAARGLTLWDIAPGRVNRDLEQWQELCAWLEQPAST
ncbi:chromosome partitioning protein [Roseateles sp. YR242]|uniref:ParA family protein n=1 Tax=Roseateles sp. YR242 TaxID=1855305 RepID=UPI0008B22E2C|nr:ParA family protein [Roseateles sp. YR242]SEL44367.1 chromosome partitioning protein [Roseateles sp. YR242]